MADLTIVDANVRAVNRNVDTEWVKVGEAVTGAFVPLVLNPQTSEYMIGDANGSNDWDDDVKGVSGGPADADGGCLMIKGGRWNPGSAVVTGTAYYLSANVGKIADGVTSSAKITRIMTAYSTSEVIVDIEITGETAP